jgi:hypothetical protein
VVIQAYYHASKFGNGGYERSPLTQTILYRHPLAASALPNEPRNMTIRYKNKQKRNDRIGAPWIGWCDAREFILFFLPRTKTKRNSYTQNSTSRKNTQANASIFFCEKSCFLPAHHDTFK